MSKRKIFLFIISPIIIYYLNLALIPLVSILAIKFIYIVIQEFLFEPYAFFIGFGLFKFIPEDWLVAEGFIPFPNPIAFLAVWLITLTLLIIITKYLGQLFSSKRYAVQKLLLGISIMMILLSFTKVESINDCESKVRSLPYLKNEEVGDVVYVYFEFSGGKNNYLMDKEKKEFMQLFGYKTIFYAEPQRYIAYIYPYTEDDLGKLCFLHTIDVLHSINPRTKNESEEIKAKFNL